MIKAVIFDLDGVLIDSEKLNALTFEKTINTCNISLQNPKEYFYQYLAGQSNRQYFYNNYPNVNRIEFEKLYFQYLNEFYSSGINKKTGATELINFCLECNLKIAIASMTMDKSRLILKLKKANLNPEIFNFIICGNSDVAPKPAPDIYLKACQELNILSSEALVIEDSNVGALAGIKAGCKTVIVKDLAIIDENIKRQVTNYIKSGSLIDIISIIKKVNYINTDHLRQDFIKFESDNQLYNIKCHGELLWPYIRWIAFHYLNDHISNGTAHFKHQYGDLKKQLWLNNYSENYLLLKNKYKNSDIFFFNSPRRSFNGQYYNSDFDCIINTLRKYYSLTLFEEPMFYWINQIQFGHLMPYTNSDILIFLDKLENDAVKLKNHYRKKRPNEYKQIYKSVKDLLKIIESKYNIKYNESFVDDFVMEWFYIKQNRKIIYKMMKASQCKAFIMFYVPTHANLLFIESANKLGIPTIEFQHGIYTDYEPIFHQVYDVNQLYWHLPKYIILYGKNTINRQLLPKNIKLYFGGKLFLEQRGLELKNIKKKPKQFLVVSQLDIKQQLSNFITELALLLPDYKFIYKLHPFEEEKFYTKVFKEFKNIYLVKPTDKDIYYYHNESTFQIGVYSTGLLEGLYYHLPTFVINSIEQSNRIKKLVDNINGVYFINSPKEIVKIIQNTKITVGNVSKIWTKCSTDSTIKIVDDIILQHKKEFISK